jgi:hypothetical protein
MKKAFYLTLALVLVLGTFSAAAFAQTRTTAFQIQNLGTDTATVTIIYYNPDGTIEYQEDNVSIPAGGSAQRNQGTETNLPDTWQGSVVIESTQPVGVIVNVNETPPYAGGAYDGFSDTRVGDSMVLPFIMVDYYGFNTDFSIQNAGADTATVSLEYIPTAPASDTKTVTGISIEPGAAYFRDQAVDDTDLTGPWSGVVVITSDQPVAAEVNENPIAGGLLLNYEGFAAGATDTMYMPVLFREYYNFNTAFQLVALEDSTAGTIDYYKTGEDTVFHSQSFSLAQYESLEQNQKFDTNLDEGFSYAAVVNITGGSAVAIVNERDNGNTLGLTYSGIASDFATGNVSMPFIIKNYYTYSTAFQVLNVGAADTFTITYSPDTTQCPACGTFTHDLTLAAGAAAECNNKFDACLDTGDSLDEGWVGSVTVEAAAGGLVVGIVNERGDDVSSDTGLVYNAFNY